MRTSTGWTTRTPAAGSDEHADRAVPRGFELEEGRENAHGGGKMKRLMIVADHSFVVQAIRLALRQTAGFQVVGFFDGRGSVRNALVELKPDVVLVDYMKEAENALARLREIAEDAP